LDALLPLPLDEFTERALVLGFDTRTIIQDGEHLEVTADYSETRLNVEVDGDTVVAVRSVG
jgi:hypothetical protein